MLYKEAPNFRTLRELLDHSARFVPITIARRIDTEGLDVVGRSDDGHVAYRTEVSPVLHQEDPVEDPVSGDVTTKGSGS